MVIIYQNWLFPTLSNKNNFDQELEWTNTHETHHHECMGHEQEFFLLGSCSLVNFTIAKGSKNVQWVLKLGFIQVDGLKMRKWGWCVHGCWGHTSRWRVWCHLWYNTTLMHIQDILGNGSHLHSKRCNSHLGRESQIHPTLCSSQVLAMGFATLWTHLFEVGRGLQSFSSSSFSLFPC